MRSFSFLLRPPRHPLLRTALALSGLALLGFFAAFALIVAGVVLTVFGARRLLRSLRGPLADSSARAVRPADPRVIDGEFSVVRKTPPLLPR
jgi:hypothetical protein